VDWDMFRIASDGNIDEYADSVCEFIRTCVEDVVPIARMCKAVIKTKRDDFEESGTKNDIFGFV
jgi:hypothetical protein